MEVVFYIEIGGGGDREGGTAHVGSFGEREHALSFARLIERSGYRPIFVVGPLIADHIRRAGFEPHVFRSPDQGIAIVRELDPALVVGCELFNVSPESARGLIDIGRPMATIDGTSLSVPINTDPFETSQFRRSLVLPEHYYVLRPCPVNDVAPDTQTAFHWSLFPDSARAHKQKDESCYRSLGLDPSRLTAMLPVAPWAMGSAAIFGLDGYYRLLMERIVDGLQSVGKPIDLIFISLFRPPALTVERAGNVDVHYPGLIPYDIYDHLLGSCDAIVTDNIISTSVSKAVVMGTPHLVVENMAPTAQPYRHNMFPLKVLFPTDRQYSLSVDRVEVSDAVAIRDALRSIFTRGYYSSDARTHRQRYLERLRALADPGRILEQIIGRPQTAGTAVC